MNLELLPNEILLDLFDYLNGVDLLCAFYGLNLRFNFLLYQQFREYYFNFNLVSKRNFDTICQQHLPFLSDRVFSLSFSNDDDTPNQINIFFSYIPSFSQFTQLRLLSVEFIHSSEMLLKILDECYRLYNLTHLILDNCLFRSDQDGFQFIVDSIWSLPKLMYFSLKINDERHLRQFTPTKISCTLESVKISVQSLTLNEVNQLYECTPCLKRLSVRILPNTYLVSTFSTLIYLNIRTHDRSEDLVLALLHNIPNLHCFVADLINTLIDGRQWEEIVRNYLPKLKVFRLTMHVRLSANENIQDAVDNLLDSFRSSFWIDERQWFIRCLTWCRSLRVHTLPFMSNYCEDKFPELWKSTYSQDNQQKIYDSIPNIYDEKFFDQHIPSYIRLRNIRSLWIQLPINEQFWTIVPSLNRLESLRISYHHDSFQSQLQTLLDRAPQLRCLGFIQDASLFLQISLFKYTSASIRELHLQNCSHYFTEAECIMLAHSPLGKQCEKLSILVNNRQNIITIIQNMIHLRVLIAKCEHDKNRHQLSLTENDDKLIQWLRDRLPSMCSITTNSIFSSEIRIWI